MIKFIYFFKFPINKNYTDQYKLIIRVQLLFNEKYNREIKQILFDRKISIQNSVFIEDDGLLIKPKTNTIIS